MSSERFSFRLILAVLLWLSPDLARAEDFDAGKSGATLFTTNCSACHHTARGLGRHMTGSSLGRFLKEHYSASSTTADRLAAYLVTVNGSARHGAPSDASPVAHHKLLRRSSLLVPRPPAEVPLR